MRTLLKRISSFFKSCLSARFRTSQMRKRLYIMLIFIGLLAFVDYVIVGRQLVISQQVDRIAQATTQLRYQVLTIEQLLTNSDGKGEIQSVEETSFSDALQRARTQLNVSYKEFLENCNQLEAVENNWLLIPSSTLDEERSVIGGLAPLIERYSSTLRDIQQKVSTAQLSESKPLVDAQLASEVSDLGLLSSTILIRLDGVLLTYERHAVDQMALLRTKNTINFTVTILALLGTAILFIKPTVDTIQQTMAKLESANTQLSKELSARQAAETAVAGKNRQKNRTLTAISHDFRTPIVSECKVLEQWIDGQFGEVNDDQLDVLRAMRLSSYTMLRMLDNTQAAYRYEDNDYQPSKRIYDINDVVSNVLDKDIPVFAKARSQTVVATLGSHLPVMTGDPVELRRAVFNLCHNAVKFSPPRCSIFIKTAYSEEDNCVTITVADEGGGVCEKLLADKEDLLGGYQCLTNKYRDIGTGVGLFLVSNILTHHGGHLLIDNDDKGAVFMMVLPVVV